MAVLSILSALRSRSTNSATVSRSHQRRRSRFIADTAGRLFHLPNSSDRCRHCAPVPPSTSCPRNSADSRAGRQPRPRSVGRSAPINAHTSSQFVRPRLPPTSSFESKPDSSVNLCPRALKGSVELAQILNIFQFDIQK